MSTLSQKSNNRKCRCGIVSVVKCYEEIRGWLCIIVRNQPPRNYVDNLHELQWANLVCHQVVSCSLLALMCTRCLGWGCVCSASGHSKDGFVFQGCVKIYVPVQLLVPEQKPALDCFLVFQKWNLGTTAQLVYRLSKPSMPHFLEHSVLSRTQHFSPERAQWDVSDVAC